VSAAAAMIVGTGEGAARATVFASSALTETLSDLRAGVAGVGSPRATLSVAAAVGSPVVLALAPAGSVNVCAGRLAAVAVPSAAAPAWGVEPGGKWVRVLEPPFDP
jgi:hypothetical protein